MYKQNQIANKINESLHTKADCQKILDEVVKKIAFSPAGDMHFSTWWGSKQIGAFRISGLYKGKRAVLKVQLVKLETSEHEMIQAFTLQNKSKLIRAPTIYKTLPYSSKARYEALIMEDAGENYVVTTPTTNKELELFFKVYDEYRNNCMSTPWIEKPKETISASIENSFNNLKKTTLNLYPNNILRKSNDESLINSAVSLLIQEYKTIPWKFQHGHLSVNDVVKKGKSFILLSNLYWSWRTPFYDLVFAYHWYRYGLSSIKGITKEMIDHQLNMWLKHIYKRAQNSNERKLLQLALLERALAGLTIDMFMMDPKQKISHYLAQKTREEISDLAKLFEQLEQE